MSTIAHRVMRRPGFLVALVAASSVLAALTVQAFLGFLSGQVGYSTSGGGADALAGLLSSLTGVSLWTAELPFAVGVLASLWLIAPVAASLRVGHVITRSLLAAGVGAVLVFPVMFVTAAVRDVVVGSITSNLVPLFRDADPWFERMRMALSGAMDQFLHGLPWVLLAGLLLWIWLERHPSRHDVVGMIDEV